MASVTMTASLLGGATTTQRPATTRRSLIVARAAILETQETAVKVDKGSNGRRAVMFAAAAAAICAVGSGNDMAMAGEEPKRGSPEAKKQYASVCVTMPTARICKY